METGLLLHDLIGNMTYHLAIDLKELLKNGTVVPLGKARFIFFSFFPDYFAIKGGSGTDHKLKKKPISILHMQITKIVV